MRLIDADALIDKTDDRYSLHEIGRRERDDIVDALEYAPTIQPKRGRWIKLDMHRGMADHKCTACKQECYVPTCMGEPMYAFCPNCGSYNGGEQE